MQFGESFFGIAPLWVAVVAERRIGASFGARPTIPLRAAPASVDLGGDQCGGASAQ
jgi:hypothetical protein